LIGTPLPPSLTYASLRKGGTSFRTNDWIRLQYRESREAELPGTVNPLVLEVMFRQQADAWSSISERRVLKIEPSLDATVQGRHQARFYRALGTLGITVLSTFLRSLKVLLPSSPHRLVCSRVQIVGRSDQGNYYDREAEI